MTDTTLASAALLPGPRDAAFYRAHGYWVSPVILPGELLDAAERGMDRYYAGDYDESPPGVGGFRPEQAEGLRKNDYASLRVRELTELVAYPLIGAAAHANAARPGELSPLPYRPRQRSQPGRRAAPVPRHPPAAGRQPLAPARDARRRGRAARQ